MGERSEGGVGDEGWMGDCESVVVRGNDVITAAAHVCTEKETQVDEGRGGYTRW